MTRISILCVLSSTLAAIALSANGASGGSSNHGGGSSAGKTVTGTTNTSRKAGGDASTAGKEFKTTAAKKDKVKVKVKSGKPIGEIVGESIDAPHHR